MTTRAFFGHDYEKFSFISYVGKNIMIQTSALLISFAPHYKQICASLKLLARRTLAALPLLPLPLSKACLLTQLLKYT